MKEGTIMKKLLYISVNSKPEDLSASKTVARKFINKKFTWLISLYVKKTMKFIVF